MKTQRLKPKRKKLSEADIRKQKFFRLKKLLPSSISLPLDGLLCAASNSFHLDVLRLEKKIPNYNGEECIYKGKPNYSMSMAIEEEWGKEASELIRDLL